MPLYKIRSASTSCCAEAKDMESAIKVFKREMMPDENDKKEFYEGFDGDDDISKKEKKAAWDEYVSDCVEPTSVELVSSDPVIR